MAVPSVEHPDLRIQHECEGVGCEFFRTQDCADRLEVEGPRRRVAGRNLGHAALERSCPRTYRTDRRHRNALPADRWRAPNVRERGRALARGVPVVQTDRLSSSERVSCSGRIVGCVRLTTPETGSASFQLSR